MSATTHRGAALSDYFVKCMADLRALQNKALERGASFLVYGGDRLCQGEVEGRLLPSRTPCWDASIAPLLNLARLQAAAAGAAAGVLGGTALQSSGDFLLVGRRGRGCLRVTTRDLK